MRTCYTQRHVRIFVSGHGRYMESTPQAWPTTKHKSGAISGQESVSEEIEMVLEEPLSLYINGQQVAVLMRLPGMEKELAAGFSAQ